MQTEGGQNWLVRKVTARLSRDLQSRIRINKVRIGFFNKLNLEGVLVEDRSRDTLLSAGLVQVRITDWFFLKDRAELEYIGLSDAVVKMQRSDSTWNYQYLVDYFASPSDGKKKESGIDFALKKVVIKNLSFVQHDAWKGADLRANVGWLDLDARQISLTKNIIDIQKLVLEDASYQEFGYTGTRTEASKAAAAAKPKAADTATLRWNPGRLWVHVSELQLKNAQFRGDKDGVLGSNKPYFDGRHIDFNGITGTVKELRFNNDTLSASADLVARERGGLQVKTLQTDLRFHPEMMEFGKLLIRTNTSTLRNYFAMRFSSFDDLGEFESKVKMEGHFDSSYVTSDDITLFAPALKSWKRAFSIDGFIKGQVDAFEGKDVTLRTGGTMLVGNFTAQGLTTPESAFLNVEARDLVTSYKEAVGFVPALRKVTTPDLRQLGTIRFSGTYTGFFQDFVAYGNLHTALGSLRTDLNMKLPTKGVPQYSGSISTASFNLGRFFNNSDLGTVAFNGNLKGRGFSRSELDLKINGDIQRFGFHGYTYQNIKANGHLDGNSFDGDFGIRDPNLEATLKGLITFGGPQPTFNATADIVKGDLKSLGLSVDPLSLSGKFRLNLTGRSLSDFTGTAGIGDAALLHNGTRLSFDSLYLSSTGSGNARTLLLRSNEIDARVQGSFDIETLPSAFQLLLNRYYPAYIKPPTRSLPPQSFTFDITTGVIEDYLKLFDPKLSGGNNSHLVGSLDLNTNTMTLQADIPQFGYQQYKFNGIRLLANGGRDSLTLNGDVANTTISDSLEMPDTHFSVRAANDVSDLSITTSSNSAVNSAALSARINTFADGVGVRFNPSSFVLNGKTWTIDEGGNLAIRRNTVTEGNVVLRQDEQEIRLSTMPAEDGANLNDLVVTLKNLNLGDVAPFLAPKNRIDGLANGTIKIEDPQNRFDVAGSVDIDRLRVDNDSVGQLQTTLSYGKRSKRLKVTGNNTDPLHKLGFDVDMYLGDSTRTQDDRISINLDDYSIVYLQNFLGSLFSDIKGSATGKLDIIGQGDNRKFVGVAHLREASMKVNFTQVKYWIPEADIKLEEDRIDFGSIPLRDSLGRTATVSGTIGHHAFQDMVFDLVARTDGAPLELLNTTYVHNQTFYGRARGTGSFELKGPQNDLDMNIVMRASDRDSSWITLPPSKSRESGNADFLVERKYGTEMTPEVLTGTATNVNYKVVLTANPLVNVKVILDDLTGDEIRGRGVGDLTIQAGTNKPLSIEGTYDIVDGSYLFTFQSFFKKPFRLKPNSSNSIRWTGDPYNAQIHFEAVYEAQNVRFAPLVQSLAINDERLERQRGDVNVVAVLEGGLFQPKFSFNLEFPENSPVNTNPSFAYGLQQIAKNVNEINKQVTYLIVFNSFAPYQAGEGSTSAGDPYNELVNNTISGVLFSGVNKLLNQVLGRVLNNSKITFNFSGSLYNRNLLTGTNRGFGFNTSSLNWTLSAPAGERVQITLAGTLDVPINGSSSTDINQRIYLYPDVSVDVLINRSGSVRATFFYTQSPDLLVSGTSANTIRNQRAGAKLSYRREFDSFSDLFRKRKRDTPPTDSSGANRDASDPTKRGAASEKR